MSDSKRLKPQVEVECPRCKKYTKFEVIPEPSTDNIVMLQREAAGEITNIEMKDGIYVCTGCLEDHNLEWLKD